MNAKMPDGSDFLTWEEPAVVARTVHVDRNDPAASDANPGTQDRPFATINAAAQVVKPGERVLVHPGIYREWVRPARGGESPERMVHFEAAKPGEMVISGAEVYDGPWRPSAGWKSSQAPGGPPLWMAALPRTWFDGYNPFATVNMVQTMEQFDFALADKNLMTGFLRRRGLVFQNGRRLSQVHRLADLHAQDGAYWIEPDGLIVHVRPFGDENPAGQRWEMTVREHAFAPETRYLGFIRISGFVIEQVADGFPVPQGGALSTARGHHWIIEDNRVRQVNAIGIDVGQQSWLSDKPQISGHHIVRRNMIEECGICGLAGTGEPENLLVEDNVFRGCCWHNVEAYYECAAIKFHLTRRALIRRNVILDTKDGAGIWLDWDNRHSRCCQNLIVGTRSIFGGIFVEASHAANLLDNNIILDTDGNGIYAHDSDRITVAHNLIARSSKAAVFLKLGGVKRWVNGRGATCRRHRVLNNLFADNATVIEFGTQDSESDGNVFGTDGNQGPLRIHRPEENLDLDAWREFHGWDRNGARAEVSVTFDRGGFLLSCTVSEPAPACSVLPEAQADYLGAPRRGHTTVAGPFARLPQESVYVGTRSSPTANGIGATVG